MRVSDLVPWRGRGTLPARRDDPFGAMQQEINRLFDDFFGGMEREGNGDGSSDLMPWRREGDAFSPTVNLAETDAAFEATVELPGMSEEEVDVNLTRDGLVISGEKRTEETEEDETRNYFRRERSYGYFSRTIPLPIEAIDRDGTEATSANGVLTVRMPKLPEVKQETRRITVRRG
jgi:HSP20 family protein